MIVKRNQAQPWNVLWYISPKLIWNSRESLDTYPIGGGAARL